MSRRPAFGSHLYSQIVVPLIVVSVGLAILASAVAVYYLNGLTSTWAKQVGESTANSVSDRYTRYTQQMTGVLAIEATDPELVTAASAGDSRRLERALQSGAGASGYTTMSLLDASGAVIGSAGASGPAPGSRPYGLIAVAPAITRVDTSGDGLVLIAVQPIGGSDGGYVLVATRTIDDALLGQITRGAPGAFGIYTPRLKRIALLMPSGLTGPDRAALQGVIDAPNGQVRHALQNQSGPESASPLTLGAASYELVTRKLQSAGQAEAVGDDYLLSVVDDSATQDAARTSMNLVFVWSTIAVMVLMALGFWVARRVSDPLVALDEGARRIADGDFSTKVEVRGHNEIARLSHTFNEMTDSLRERSESLTKKVLELATLYEMSRSLGSTLEMDQLLGSVLDSALRIFDLDVGYVALRDKDSGELEVLSVRGADESLVGGSEVVRASMAGWVVREARPLIFNPDPATGDSRIDSLTGAKAALCVPLVSSDGTIGAMTVGSNDPEYRFTSDDVRLLSTIGNHVTMAIGNIELFSRLQDAYFATVRSLAAAVDAKDTYTRGHSDRVATYAVAVAERFNIAHEQRTALEMAAYLHDIGKIGVPEAILLKPGALTAEEMSQMRHHPLIGADILRPVAFPWAITPIVRHHHEYWDGSGYPAGLKAEEIPLLARILCVADSYEAMTADRPYRHGRSVDDAIEELRRCSGTQFDPAIVPVMIAIVEEERLAEEGVHREALDEAGIDDARAIFSGLVSGVLASFRRLGGPRLASNVEAETDQYFRAEATPFRIAGGHVSFDEATSIAPAEEISCMRRALRHLDAAIGRVSGGTLVDHFYDEALEGLSSRMSRVADELGFLAR